MSSVGIIGYGRFGQVLTKLLSQDFELRIFDPTIKDNNNPLFADEESVLQSETLFIAVPIHEFETVIKNISPKISSDTTIIDVCSIKIHPVEIMKKYLPEKVGIIATHPMFGPDSIDAKDRLNFMMHNVRDLHHCYDIWKTFFSGKGFNIIEITPDEHDRLAAESQSIIHFIARILNDFGIHPTPIDTQGFKDLLTLVENNCHDTWALFSDLQNYNPYAKDMIKKLEQSFNNIKTKLKNMPQDG